MSDPVRVRRLTDYEGQRLQQIVRRGTGSAVRLRRAMVVLASAGGNTVPAIARLVRGDEDAVRGVIHRFNELGKASLDPQWAGGRLRLISPEDEVFIVATATTRPEALEQPFTRWSLRKLAAFLASNATRRVRIGRERLRQFLHKHEITFQRTVGRGASGCGDRIYHRKTGTARLSNRAPRHHRTTKAAFLDHHHVSSASAW